MIQSSLRLLVIASMLALGCNKTSPIAGNLKLVTADLSYPNERRVGGILQPSLSITLSEGQYSSIKAIWSPEQTPADVHWISSNPAVCLVNDTGGIIGKSTGTALISATAISANATASFPVTVSKWTTFYKLFQYFETSALVVDAVGNKWIGTQNEGLIKFDGTNWTQFTTANSGMVNNRVVSLALDNNGLLWIGTENGLSTYDGIQWHFYSTASSDYLGTLPTEIVPDRQGNIWLVINGNLVKFDGQTYTLIFRKTLYLYVTTVNIDAQGVTWFAGNKLWKVEGNQYVEMANAMNSSNSSEIVVGMCIDSKGNKWFLSSDGVVKFDGRAWAVFNQGNSGIQTPIRVREDKQGNIWVTCGGSGAFRYDGTQWTAYNTNGLAYPFIYVYDVAFDPEGNKWFSGSGKLLKLFNQNY